MHVRTEVKIFRDFRNKRHNFVYTIFFSLFLLFSGDAQSDRRTDNINYMNMDTSQLIIH